MDFLKDTLSLSKSAVIDTVALALRKQWDAPRKSAWYAKVELHHIARIEAMKHLPKYYFKCYKISYCMEIMREMKFVSGAY